MRNGMILVDLQKAFDTLFELFLKNEIIWFLESVNKWFESYFSKQKVFGLCWCFFWGWNIKVPCTTRLYSWITPLSIICKWSSPIIIRHRLLFACRWHCIFYQHEEVKKIENILSQQFSSLYQWFIDNKLSIHFRGDKTKTILF